MTAPESSSSGTTTLLPCPFCGETRISLNAPNEYHRRGSINCPACLVVLPGEADQAELIECWNNRSSDVAQRPVERDEPPLARLLKEVDPDLANILTDNAAWVALIRNNVVTACANVAAGHSPSDYTADGMRNGIVAAIKGLMVPSTEPGGAAK